jgi:hypothetical protein
MASLSAWRRVVAAGLLIVAETAAALVISTALIAPASAQFFGDRWEIFPDMNRRRFQPFEPRRDAPPPDNSKAPPPPRRADAAPETQIVVVGDSMADWMGYGLESALSDTPEMGVLRKHRTSSGLIRNDLRNDPDWPQIAREIVAGEKASIVVMMIGLHDRKEIRERAPAPVPARTPAAQQGQGGQAAQQPQQGQGAQQQAQQPPAQPQQQPAAPPPAASTDAEGGDAPPIPAPEPRGATIGTHEFRSEKWVELYGKRIDETIAQLKAKGATVLWVGLPPIRGTRSTSDALFLNDIYRGRAEKNGAIYVDIWDGFADESGRFTTMGPDVDGQIRRLRSADGVHYTQAGARKLAHFVEREVKRVLAARTGPIAIPVPQDTPMQQQPAPLPGTPMARPQAGPVMPLTAAIGTQEDLLGGGPAAQKPTDAIASRVLVKGDPMPAPAGRADDFAWPRRAVAPVGQDPIATTTTLPMTPMVAQPPQEPSRQQQGTATAARTEGQGSRPPSERGPRTAGPSGGFRPPGGFHSRDPRDQRFDPRDPRSQQQAQQGRPQQGNSFFFLFSPR